jgi:phosphoserine phosphatase RsbU/P
VLGIFAESAYRSIRSSVEPGDRFILYTDGILEAPSPSGEEFGLERLKGFTEQFSARSRQEFCDSLMARLEAWCGKIGLAHDDLTVIVVDCEPVKQRPQDVSADTIG